jgi:hypothetical protein
LKRKENPVMADDYVSGSETPMTDTIKAGSTLIEEGAPLLESVSFESKAWTSFYMAGETIRQLRRGLGMEAVAPERPEDYRLDEEASSRMDDEGCLNKRAATV